MYRNCKIALVIPARNEENLIIPTLQSVPDYVDKIYVIDDGSTDDTANLVKKYPDKRVELICHEKNYGPGAAIITGYQKARKEEFDAVAVCGGDNQMPLEQLKNLLDPIIDQKADYTKGNRFFENNFAETVSKMPRIRLFANWLITCLTKIASGYYKTMDVVDGYTVISKKALKTINFSKAWKGYGYPMDFLVRLNAYGFRTMDIPRTAIYLPGERQSQIKGFQYAMKVSPMLVRDFFWRINFKYFYRDFHPLVLFYYLGIILVGLSILGGSYLVVDKIFFGGYGVTAPRSILIALMFISGTQFLLFAMLFDMEQSHK